MKNWKKYNGTLIPNNPPHFKVEESEKEIMELIKRTNSYFARWCSDFDCNYITDFWYVINDTPLKIEDYSIKVRNKIRKGLKEFDVIPVNKDKFLEEAFQVYLSAIKSYNTGSILLENEFVDSITPFETKIEFWGIYKNSKMVGYAIVKIDFDVCEYESIKFNPSYLRLRPSEALIYTLNQTYLNKRNFKYVNNGSRSLYHNTNFQLFLERKFKFRKAYCRMNIIYTPWVRLMLALLFPLKSFFSIFNNRITNKIMVLIRHEKIRKSFLEQ